MNGNRVDSGGQEVQGVIRDALGKYKGLQGMTEDFHTDRGS